MVLVKQRIQECIDIKKKLLQDEIILKQIKEISEEIDRCLKNDGKVLLCGNGGSASDALHIAAELVGRFQKERKSFCAIALNADVATMTSIANDYGYDYVFERMVEGLLKPNDILLGISTSGNSENIYRAILKANVIKGKTIAFLGKDGGKINNIANHSIVIPSDSTARIQEIHIMIAHIICELIEEIY